MHFSVLGVSLELGKYNIRGKFKFSRGENQQDERSSSAVLKWAKESNEPCQRDPHSNPHVLWR